MQNRCVNSRRPTTVICGVLASALAILSGCASEPLTARSSLTREKGISIAQQTADTLGARVFTIAPTGSMKPTLDENSIVAVESVKFEELRAGDIVIYRDKTGLPIVHRLLEKKGAQWIVLGDNNPGIDRETVTQTNLVGRVCAIFYTSPGRAGSGQEALAHR